MNARNGIKVCNRCRKPKPVAEYMIDRTSARYGNCRWCRMAIRAEMLARIPHPIELVAT
jgi:hypothetical protein